MQANDLQGARAAFQLAIQHDPDNGKAFGYLGIVKSRLGDSTGGILDLQQAVRLQPTDSDALYNLAVALAQANRVADAREALQYALSLEPANTRVRAALDKLNATAVVVQQAAYAPPPSAPLVASPLGGGVSVGSPMPLSGPQPLTAPQPLTGAPLGGPMPLTGEAIAPANYGTPSPYSAPPSPYGTPGGTMYSGPAPAYGGPPSVYGGPGMAGSQGRQLGQFAKPPPTTGQRIGRGLLWGALLGQMWTVYIAVVLIIGGLALAGLGAGGLITISIALVLFVVALVNAFVFGIAGSIIGAADMDEDQGAVVGIVASLFIVGGQFLLGMRGGLGLVLGIIFAISFGRGVGIGIAKQIDP